MHRAEALAKLLREDGNIAVASVEQVDVRDNISVEDTATGKEIVCKDYYSFNAAAWKALIEAHFAGGSKDGAAKAE